jgi:hypothetical protein
MALTGPFAVPNSVRTPRIEALFTLASIAVCWKLAIYEKHSQPLCLLLKLLIPRAFTMSNQRVGGSS